MQRTCKFVLVKSKQPDKQSNSEKKKCFLSSPKKVRTFKICQKNSKVAKDFEGRGETKFEWSQNICFVYPTNIL